MRGHHPSGGADCHDQLDSLMRSYRYRCKKQPREQAIGTIVGELIARRGFGRVRSQEYLEEAWRRAIGQPAARCTRVGAFRRGTLEVLVRSSVVLQELAHFQKQSLLEELRRTIGSDEVRDLKFRLDTEV